MADDISEEQNLAAQSTASLASLYSVSSAARDVHALGRKVDRIKGLIRLSNSIPAQGIGQQIFRNTSTERVSEARVLHELDRLKKLLRDAQKQRRASDADPDDSSSSSDELDLDENDNEMQDLRDELEHVRKQREEWLAAAETKIDTLMDEKEGLTEYLHENRELLEYREKEKVQLEESLHKTEAQSSKLSEEATELRTTLNDLKEQESKLQKDRDSTMSSLAAMQKDHGELQTSHNTLEGSLVALRNEFDALTQAKQTSNSAAAVAEKNIQDLRKLRGDIATSLEKSSRRVFELEAQNKDAAEHLRNAVEEHVTERSKHQAEMTAVLNARVQTESAAEDAKAAIDQMQPKLILSIADAERFRKELQEERTARAGEVHSQRTQADEASRSLDSTRISLEQLQREHEDVMERMKGLDKANQQLESKHKSATQEVQDLCREHESEQANLRAQIAEQSERVRISEESLGGTKREYETQLVSMAEAHDAEQKRLHKNLIDERDVRANETEAVEEHHRQDAEFSKGELLESKRSAEVLQQELKTLTEKHEVAIENATKSLEMEKVAKAGELDSLRAEHVQQDAAIRDELGGIKRRAKELENELEGAKTDNEAQHDRFDEALSKAHDSRARETESLSLKHKQDMASMSAELSGARRIMAELEQRLEILSDKHEAELNAKETTLAGQQASSTKQMDAQKAQHARDLESVRMELDAARRNTADAEEQSQKLNAEHDVQRKRLEDSLADRQELNITEIKTIRGQHEEELGSVISELAAAKRSVNEKTEESGSAHEQLQNARHVAEAAARRAQDLQAEHGAERKRLQVSLAESRNSSSRDVESLNARHADELGSVRLELGAAKQSAEEAKRRSEELKESSRAEIKKKDKLVAEQQEARATERANAKKASDDAEQRFTDLQAQNSEELLRKDGLISEQKAASAKRSEALRAQHDTEESAARDELNASRQLLEDSNTKSKTKLAELAGRLSAITKEHKAMREQLQRTEESHRLRIEDDEAALAETEQQLVMSNKRVEELDISMSTTQAEMESSLSEHKNRLADAESQLKEAETKNADLFKAFEEAQTRLEGEKSSRESIVKTMESKYAAELEQHRLDHEEALLSTKIDATARQEEQTRNHAGEVKSLHESHAAALDTVRANAGSESERLKDQHSKEIETIVTEHKSKAIEAEKKTNTRTAALEGEHSTALRDLRLRHEQTLAERASTYDSKMLDARLTFEARMKTVNETHKTALDDALRDHERVLSERTSENENAMAALLAEKEQQLKAHQLLEVEHDKALQDVSNRHQQNLADRKDAHEAEMSQFTADRQAQLDDEKLKHQSDIARLEARHADDVQAADASYKTQAADYDDRTRALEETHNSAIAKLQFSHEEQAAELSGLQSQLEHEKADKMNAEEDTQKRVAELDATAAKDKEMLQNKYSHKVTSLLREHAQTRDALQSMKDSFSKQQAEIESEHAVKLAEAEKSYHAASHRAADAAQRSESLLKQEHADHINKLDKAAAEQEAVVSKLQEELSTVRTQLLTAEKSHAHETGNMEDGHAAAIEEAWRDVERSAKTQTELERQVADARSALDSSIIEIQQRHESELRSAKDAVQAEIELMKASHEKALSYERGGREETLTVIRDEHLKEMEHVKQAAAEANTEYSQTMEQKLLAAAENAHLEVARMTNEYQSALEGAQRKHSEETAKLEKGHTSSLQELKDEYARSISAKDQDHEERIAQSQNSHDVASSQAIEETRKRVREVAEVRRIFQNLQRKLEEQLAKAREDLRDALAQRDTHQTEKETLCRGFDEHKQALDSQRGRADAAEKELHEHTAGTQRDLEEALAQLETGAVEREAHLKEINGLKQTLKAQQDEAKNFETKPRQDLKAATHQTTESSGKLTALVTEVANLEEVLQKAEAHREETVQSLQAHNDESTNLATQRYLGSDASELEVQTLRKQNDDLEEQNKRIEESLRGEARKHIEQDRQRSEEVLILSEQVASLAKQLATAQEEQKEAQAFLQTKLDEKNTLASRNEELSNRLSAQIEQSVLPNGTLNADINALLQTDGVRPVPERDRSARGIEDAAPVPVASGSNLNPLTISPSEVGAKERGRQSRLRKSPTSRTMSVSLESDSKKLSFEDYLQNAEAELSELGNAITQNEALFALKIKEHVGDLQKAKDQLSREYKDRFDALLADRATIERDLTKEQAAELASKRNELAASYGQDQKVHAGGEDKKPSQPTHKTRAFKNADEKLVAEYKRRVWKRKSQIAMKHAEELQRLAEDYDDRIVELIDHKEKLGSDLSIEPARFEELEAELDAKSVQLEAEKASSVTSSPQSTFKKEERETFHTPPTGLSVSTERSGRAQLPKRITPASPSTPTSNPRAQPWHASKEQADVAPGAARSPRTPDGGRSSSPRRVPVPPRYLIRVKSPPDGPIPRRIVTEPRRSEKWASPTEARSNTTIDLKTTPDRFERMAGERPTAKPSVDVAQRAKMAEDRLTSVGSINVTHSSPRTSEPNTLRKVRGPSTSIFGRIPWRSGGA